MDIEKILEQVDRLLAQKKGDEAESLLLESAVYAVEHEDDESLLQLLNELLGYYRETGQAENVDTCASRAVGLARRMGLEGTLPYATTLLNVANAYRACGRLAESAACYREVEEIYGRLLPPDSPAIAGLKNNRSLLYQETGEYEKAKRQQEEALAIVAGDGLAYETAVTLANLAGTCVQLGQTAEARSYAEQSLAVFEENGVADSHYAAAVAALAACCMQEGSYGQAAEYYGQAMQLVESFLGRNEGWHRLRQQRENAATAAREARENQRETAAREAQEIQRGTGLALAESYYLAYGRRMIAEKFPAYESRIAVGLAGRGSDCFGYDDAASRDHDWGPDFCMWVTDETYEQIGEALQQAYLEMPAEYKGYCRAPHVNGKNRRGVIRISDFYKSFVGTENYEEINWRETEDYALAAAVNGKVFRDDEGIFSAMRRKLLQGYPQEVRYLKLAQSMARFSQDAQYNFPRMWRRGDRLTAEMLLLDGIREAMRICYYAENKYPPHDKWLRTGLESLAADAAVGERLTALEQTLANRADDCGQLCACVEELAGLLALKLYADDLISDIDPYLEHHSEELLYKASFAGKTHGELAGEIARLEFEAFDKVHNEGGRASCQNDWSTFSIMRRSQYLTWNHTMLLQYLYDFWREYTHGHNLIEEKYGRMMESTAPEKYEELKAHFPTLTEEKKEIIEQICSMQVGWMEAFAESYPALAANARSIHTEQDNPFDTSYETYLRGELCTYSDKMLELYGRYIVEYARTGRNPAYEIMENSVRMYGYQSLDEAEKKMTEARR